MFLQNLIIFTLIVLMAPNTYAWKTGSNLLPTHHKMLQEWKILTHTEYKEGRVGGKAEGLINATTAEVWEVLIETTNWKNFIPRVKESKEVPAQLVAQLEKQQEGRQTTLMKLSEESSKSSRRRGEIWEVYPFEVFDFPWPISNRWVVNQLVNNESNSEKGKYRGDWRMLIGNFRHNEGYWSVEPYSKNPRLSHFTIYLLNDPGVDVPNLLIKIGNHFTLPAIVRGVREEVSSRQKQASQNERGQSLGS